MIIARWQAPNIPDQKQIMNMFLAEGFEPFIETIEAKSKLPDHRHPFDEIRMVSSGQLILNIAGNKLLLRAGDRIIIPSNTKHSKSVEADEDCICVCANKL